MATDEKFVFSLEIISVWFMSILLPEKPNSFSSEIIIFER